MKEQQKFEVIKRIVDNDGNKKRAALEIGCSQKTVSRLISGYKNHGKMFFSHKNKGRRPHNALSDKLRKKIVGLYNTKYNDASFEFFTELLAKEENIHVSASTVRGILMGENILSPKANKATIRRVKKELETELNKHISKREKTKIEQKLVDIEDAHPRRPRCANFGEELQMDASVHNWFGDDDSHLHAAIDDATGKLTGLYFDWQETLNGYYNVFNLTLNTYGIPYKFRTDKRTVFEYKLKNTKRIEDDTFTQFAYACHQLGVHLETTSIPQAKGRIERVFGTLQGRLPILLRLAGITTIEAANEFLTTYVDEFNKQFALNHNAIPSVFEKQPSEDKINTTLAVLTERTIDAGHCIKFYGKYYRTLGNDGNYMNLAKGTKGLVIKAFDESLFFSAADKVMALENVPERKSVSPEFSVSDSHKKKTRYIPPMDHPWRTSSFGKFCSKQKQNKTLSPVA
jgi:transposase